MGFCPGRQLIVLLCPMNERGFLAPLQQLAHGRAVWLGLHESSHGGLGVPAGTRPERVACVTKYFRRQIPFSVACLPADAVSCEEKSRDEAPRPHPQAGN